MAVHWVASFWEHASPGVGKHLRRLADRMAAKAQILKEQEMGKRPPSSVVIDPAVGVLTEPEDPLDEGWNTTNEEITKPNGVPLGDSDEKT